MRCPRLLRKGRPHAGIGIGLHKDGIAALSRRPLVALPGNRIVVFLIPAHEKGVVGKGWLMRGRIRLPFQNKQWDVIHVQCPHDLCLVTDGDASLGVLVGPYATAGGVNGQQPRDGNPVDFDDPAQVFATTVGHVLWGRSKCVWPSGAHGIEHRLGRSQAEGAGLRARPLPVDPSENKAGQRLGRGATLPDGPLHQALLIRGEAVQRPRRPGAAPPRRHHHMLAVQHLDGSDFNIKRASPAKQRQEDGETT